MTEGFLYIATGREYLEEAEYSANQLRETHPNANIAVVTGLKPRSNIFDETIEPDGRGEGFGTKVHNLHKLPYDKTVFLDTDTYVDGDITEIFDILDKYDIACVRKQDYYVKDGYIRSIPDCYPEFNTGVIGLRKSENTSAVLKTFREYWAENNYEFNGDQPAFRYATYFEDAQLIQLGPEYNCRFTIPGLLTQQAKVFHGRKEEKPYGSEEYDKFIRDLTAGLNKHATTPRVYLPFRNSVNIYLTPESLQSESMISQLFSSIKMRGPLGFIKHNIRKLIGSDRYSGVFN